MKLTQEGIDLVKRFEGCRLKAYKCPAGVWTIGYGHTKGVKQNDVITQAQAEEYLAQDLQEAGKEVVRLVKVPLNDNQFSALCSFVFNVGAGNLQKSTLLKLLNQGQKDAVPEQLLRWTKSKGIVLRGLMARRLSEAILWTKNA
jgi:lysozyme